MANTADSDQLASDLDLHCLQRQGISGFSRTRVKIKFSQEKRFAIVCSVNIKVYFLGKIRKVFSVCRPLNKLTE